LVFWVFWVLLVLFIRVKSFNFDPPKWNRQRSTMSEDFDKDGILWKRIGSDPNKKRKFGQKKWNLVYVNLIGGSIHYYKDEDDIEPKGTIQLADLKLNKVDNQGSSSKKFCFSMKNDKLDYLFAAEEEAEWKSWVSAIEGNLGKPAAAPLKKEKRKSRAAQLAFKAKKKMSLAKLPRRRSERRQLDLTPLKKSPT